MCFYHFFGTNIFVVNNNASEVIHKEKCFCGAWSIQEQGECPMGDHWVSPHEEFGPEPYHSEMSWNQDRARDRRSTRGGPWSQLTSSSSSSTAKHFPVVLIAGRGGPTETLVVLIAGRPTAQPIAAGFMLPAGPRRSGAIYSVSAGAAAQRHSL